MPSGAAELARRLARDAEAVCRHYLDNGCRQGRYWVIGDVANAPGRSMFVRLSGPESGPGAAGHWTDAATGQHGDLLDLIALNRGLDRPRDAFAEARAFLRLPRPEPKRSGPPVPAGSPDAARRLFAIGQPLQCTLGATYLRRRGITALHGTAALRFHPRCYYRPGGDPPTETWPALIAAVTDLSGRITGVHRTWLDPSGRGKAPVDSPRRAMGYLLGNAVRFGVAADVMSAGEGIETVLSLRCVLPGMPMMAALSANHLAVLVLPPTVRRLYVVRDRDPAGDRATAALTARAQSAGVEALSLSGALGDFNDDLRRLGIEVLRDSVARQLAAEDAWRFMREGRRRG
jgi:Toprim domain